MRESTMLIVATLVATISLAGWAPASAGSSTAEEVRQHVVDYFATIRETLQDPPDAVHPDGALQFWSSGGLLQEVAVDGESTRYDAFNLRPKHIRVVVISEGEAAVVMYYAEGAMTPKGNSPVPHYLTRVTEVLVKDGGKWKSRAGHWSQILGGSGTSQSAE
ncbi:MAG: hypothetical protein O7A04_09945 [Acidobacteria bacterium]|nr:hypothetical protein [Acidobacteriota bacterium]